ncbi:TPA: zinc ribbon domain-containing protein [Thermoplasmata archaeon]|nr:zinc ribbon domain-containing protein [Thermoplasmata archaeon]
MKFCGGCGSELLPPAVTQDAQRNRHCVNCGRVIGWDANACQYCGHDYRKKKGEETKESAVNALLVGAIFSILAGIVSTMLVMVINMEGSGPSNAELVVSSMMYLFAVLAIIGGLSSLAKVSYPMSVLGAACSIFGPGFFFGVPALVLTAKSAAAFEKDEAG